MAPSPQKRKNKAPAPKRRYIKRTFSGMGRGRPETGAVSDEEIEGIFGKLDGPKPLPVGDEADKARYESSFKDFLFECFDFPDLDPLLHGQLASFAGRLKGSPPAMPSFWSTRVDLEARRISPPPGATADKPYGIDLDGDLLGVAHIDRGDGADKLLLIPRNSLKSTIMSVAYPLWRIVRNPAIRVLLSSAVGKDACKFLRSIKWQLTNNKKIEKFWPNVHITQDMIAQCKVLWTQKEITVPRTVRYEAGESTVECMGVGGNLVSRHYDLIICDDLVNNRNSKTQHLLEDTIEWFQNAHSLLDPVSGEVIVVGTRWDYNDLYSHLIAEHNQKYSLFFATVHGADLEVFFPQKFSKEKVVALRKTHGPYKFSCQYLNQPVDKENQDFKVSWLRYYCVQDAGGPTDERGRPHLPSGFNWRYYAAMDVAITEDDGDQSVVAVVAVNDRNDWYVQEIFTAQYGQIEKLVDMIFEVQQKYPQIMQFAIETRSWQRTIASGAYERMRKRNVWLTIVELKSESNVSKGARIMRLVPRCASGGLFLPGKGPEDLKGGVKTLFSQYVRFPRGGDDALDALAYVDMIPAVPPEGPNTVSDNRMSASERARRHRKALMRKKSERVDEHLGTLY